MLNNSGQKDFENKTTGKGHPTPKRKEVEKQKIHTLIPSDRKEAKRLERKKRNEFYERQRIALATGDEKYLPAKDKGKVRRWVRNWVDARFSWCEYLFPVTLIILVGSLFFQNNPVMQVRILVALYLVFITCFIDAIIATIIVKRRIRKHFISSDIPPRIGVYAFMRMLLLPIMRSPKPQVHKREWPK